MHDWRPVISKRYWAIKNTRRDTKKCDRLDNVLLDRSSSAAAVGLVLRHPRLVSSYSFLSNFLFFLSCLFISLFLTSYIKSQIFFLSLSHFVIFLVSDQSLLTTLTAVIFVFLLFPLFFLTARNLSFESSFFRIQWNGSFSITITFRLKKATSKKKIDFALKYQSLTIKSRLGKKRDKIVCGIRDSM